MTFVVPKKRISAPADMAAWQNSMAYKDYVQFIKDLNQSVMGRDNNTACTESETLKNTVTMLDNLDKWIDEIPPVQQPQRFGNQAFRTYHARLVEKADHLLRSVLPEALHAAIPELVPYFTDSFGNSTRIDYGTGHEANFVMLLYCMFKIQAFTKPDGVAVVTRVFRRYLELCRRLQLTYKMEPAGSHGVWSLDDFQFMSFIWGSSQLVEHPDYQPKSYLDEGLVSKTKDQYLWMGSIEFIGKVKTGPFAEHSNQLWSISDVHSWSKVNTGLLKMYEVEVLKKFPVVQHFLFGSLLAFDQI